MNGGAASTASIIGGNTPVIELHPAVARAQRSQELTSAIGMMMALGAWTMTFGAFFVVCLGLRARAVSWPPPGVPPLPLLLPSINTVVIVASSFTLAHALKQLRRGEHARSLQWMLATFGLGATFVALQVALWYGLWTTGITSATGTLGTVFYGLTGLHAVHVAAGLAVLGYLVVVARRRARGATSMQRQVISLRVCGMFWHFVDVVWILMFVGLFLT